MRSNPQVVCPFRHFGGQGLAWWQVKLAQQAKLSGPGLRLWRFDSGQIGSSKADISLVPQGKNKSFDRGFGFFRVGTQNPAEIQVGSF